MSRALTLHPEAGWLVANGRKTYVVRERPTQYRGLVLLHAAQAPQRMRRTHALRMSLGAVEAGNFFGYAEITDCVRAGDPRLLRLSDMELACDDFRAGHAWRLGRVWRFDIPIPYCLPGRNGLWIIRTPVCLADHPCVLVRPASRDKRLPKELPCG